MPAPPQSKRVLRFGDFVVHVRSCELYRGGTRIKLQEQPFKVLRMLLEQPGELITREELRQKVWRNDTFVDFDHSINVAIGKIREALNDSSDEPRFVETLAGRGYRFIANVEEVASPSSAQRPGRRAPIPQRHSVGREKELRELRAGFESVAGGRGLLLCVVGEPGIGKTTLLQDFFANLQSSGTNFGLAIGRCSQRLAGEEAYLPFLEVLESLLCNDGGTRHRLRELAPNWYAQLFPLSESDPSDARLRQYVTTTTQERVKRELAAFLCEIARQNPLVLFFDDVHWTDPSTVDLLSYLATKFDGTRILVIVTYRPSELLLLKHPFIGVKRELQARALCREIEVEFLSAGDVERYIALEFMGNAFPHDFAGLIHARTEGNPLFMVDLLRYLRDRGIIVKTDEGSNWLLAESLPDLSRNIPQSITSVIERKIDQLSDRGREVLTASAVQGFEFDSAALARSLEVNIVEIEEILDWLERVHTFVKRVGEDELPNRFPTVRYRFVHVLYQNALYAFLTPSRRIALGTALAHALEALYSDRSSAIASQLAFLYETAREPGRAADYFLLAAQNAQRIFANQEAIILARRGLALLSKIPETLERTQKEFSLQVTLAFSSWTQGYSSTEAGTNLTRARELCLVLGDTALLFPLNFALWTHYLCKPNLKSAREAAGQLTTIARNVNDPALLIISHAAWAFTFQHEGDQVACRQNFEEACRLYDVGQRSRYLQMYRLDPGVHCDSELVRTLWLLGFPEQAQRKIEAALAMARTLAIPLSLACAQRVASILYQNLRQLEKAKEIGEECIALCEEQGVLLEGAWAKCTYGWAIAELGQVEAGISHIRAGLKTQLSLGSEVARPEFQAMATEALWHAGRTEEAWQSVEDGLAASERNGEPYFDAELWRLKGELLKMQNKTAEAESCFQKAIEIARRQAAKSLELRACTSLARLWQKQGKRKEAQQLLSEIYAWFTEGFDTADLREAALLLEDLS